MWDLRHSKSDTQLRFDFGFSSNIFVLMFIYIIYFFVSSLQRCVALPVGATRCHCKSHNTQAAGGNLTHGTRYSG